MKQAIDKFTMELPGMDTKQDAEDNPVHEAVLFYWGERCPEHDPECVVCKGYALYDRMIGGLK
jgi:hypothetical protein